MVELRYVKRNTGRYVKDSEGWNKLEVENVLQFRVRVLYVDIQGNLVDPDFDKRQDWSEWMDVPTIDETYFGQ